MLIDIDVDFRRKIRLELVGCGEVGVQIAGKFYSGAVEIDDTTEKPACPPPMMMVSNSFMCDLLGVVSRNWRRGSRRDCVSFWRRWSILGGF